MPAPLTLVRHATSVRPTPDGPSQLERPLSAEGLAEAERLADELAGGGFAFACSSPYRRAIDTIAPTARRHGLTIEEWPDVREWESGLAPLADGAWQVAYRAAWAEPSLRQGDGGESLVDLGARATRQIERAMAISERVGPVLMASHGTWMARALLDAGVPVDVEFWLAMPMPAVYRWHRVGDGYSVTGPGVDDSPAVL